MKRNTHLKTAALITPRVNISSSVHWSRSLLEAKALDAGTQRHITVSPLREFVKYYWPLALVALACSGLILLWENHARLTVNYKNLEGMNTDLMEVQMRQAQMAFQAGDFRKAEYLLRPVGLSRPDDMPLQLLRARIFECTGQFNDAANAYQKVVWKSEATPEIHSALLFCRRMASERHATLPPSREVLYRLHSELMRRGEIAQARTIALDLKPDMQPLQESTAAVLKENDVDAEITKSRSEGRVDVKISIINPHVVNLLRDLKIGKLVARDADVNNTEMFAGLDLEELQLARNPVGDVSSLRTMDGLRSLNISDSGVADIRSLAGLPLRELDLSHTKVSSLYPLILCPLESLNLASLPVHDLSPLRGFALRDLDLSRTKVEDISVLEHQPLQALHLDGTKVHDLTPLAGVKLRVLTLSGTPVTDISALSGMPLVELDLRGCIQITDLSPLENCSKLEKLYLPKGVHLPPAIMRLPRLKIITH